MPNKNQRKKPQEFYQKRQTSERYILRAEVQRKETRRRWKSSRGNRNIEDQSSRKKNKKRGLQKNQREVIPTESVKGIRVLRLAIMSVSL